MFRITKLFLLSVAALLISACTTSTPPKDQADMPNPASVFCEEQGGQVEMRTDSEGGQFGVCIFEDGSECDEWAFYRGECPAQADMPNPASAFCEEQGGKLEIRTDSEGGQFGVCILEDGTECDEWEYFRGECPTQAGMPNPASVFCEDQGGKLEIRTDSEGGQFGVCIFEDGSECDEWAFFRGECQPGEPKDSSSTSSPSYINDTYGFTLNTSEEWEIEEHDDYLILRRPDFTVFVGYQWADEELKPFRTGMPQGDFIDGGTAMLFGQSIPKRILVWEEKYKVIDYGGRIKAGDLIFVFYLDGVESDAISYNDIDLTPEIIAEVDQIIASLALTSGETPTLEINP
jgi:putative hemolysin